FITARNCFGRKLERCCPFFFSSRRRHTRFSRDWSSDVCSSDLVVGDTPDASWRVNGRVYATQIIGNTVVVGGAFTTATSSSGERSEERRVGKGGRAGRVPELLNEEK